MVTSASLARSLLTIVCWRSPGPGPCSRKPPRDAALRITVADQTGAVIVNARVTIQPTEPAGPAIEVMTDERGEAVPLALAPGGTSFARSSPASSHGSWTTSGCVPAATRGER